MRSDEPRIRQTTTLSHRRQMVRPSDIVQRTPPVEKAVLARIAQWANRGGWSDVSVEESYPETSAYARRDTGRMYYGIGWIEDGRERTAEFYHDPADGSFTWRGKPIEDRLFG